ncbi:ABC transporter permease [Legionella fairfieldensis]|uniref:ABC transporter permease n=1 Tax=Legionella fairfieldensis TaxID=45064 RepID=UPI00048BABC1|nr:ABC transporter permease [Legionella fairfieldensis]
MHLSRRFHFYGKRRIESVILFFRFIGHVFYSLKEIFLRRLTLSWSHLLDTVFHSGAKIAIPLILLSSLIGISLVLNIFHILSRYNLQHNVLIIAQYVLFYDLLPFLIGLMLSVQSALNLITARIKEHQKTPQDVIVVHIIPIMIGTNFNGLILYAYALNTVLISIYFCFRYFFSFDLHEYIFHLTNTISGTAILYSILKTFVYCTMVSLIVGYYYYEATEGYLSLKQAISRIMTRSFMVLIVSSIYFKFLDY